MVQNAFSRVKTPGKSTLERYDKWLPAEALARFNQQIFAAASGGQSQPGALGLHAPVKSDEVFFDFTCMNHLTMAMSAAGCRTDAEPARKKRYGRKDLTRSEKLRVCLPCPFSSPNDDRAGS